MNIWSALIYHNNSYSRDHFLFTMYSTRNKYGKTTMAIVMALYYKYVEEDIHLRLAEILQSINTYNNQELFTKYQYPMES